MTTTTICGATMHGIAAALTPVTAEGGIVPEPALVGRGVGAGESELITAKLERSHRAADRFGYSQPFTELPEVSVLVVTVAMTAPMTAWMLFRRVPRRSTAEMSAVMPALAILLLGLGWLDVPPAQPLHRPNGPLG